MSILLRLKRTAAVVALPLVGGALAFGAEAQEAIDLRMAIWSANEGHLALFNEIATAYTAQNPNVTVTFDSLPFADFTTTLTTQIAGGNAPDLAWILENAATDFVTSGALVALTDTFAAADGYDLADVTDSALGLWKVDGDIFAYPFSTSPFGIFVNNDVIAGTGERTPAALIADGAWTWDNAMAISAAAGAAGNTGLIVRDFDYQAWQMLATIWNGWGAAPWSAEGQTCTFAEPPMVDAMSFIHDAIFAQGAMPEPGTTADFFSGEAAMTITQISRASLLPKENAFDWDLVPLPQGPAGDYAVIGQAGIGVFAQGKNPDVAADFLAFFSNPENSAKLARFFPPARASLLNAAVLGAANPLLSEDQLDAVVVEGIATGDVLPSHAGFAEIQQTTRAALDALWVADADVPAVLGAVCDRLQPMLAR